MCGGDDGGVDLIKQISIHNVKTVFLITKTSMCECNCLVCSSVDDLSKWILIYNAKTVFASLNQVISVA